MDIRLAAPIATCLAILVSIYLWHLNRKRALSYSILRRSPLLNLKGAVCNEFDIHYGGHSVLDAYLIVVRVFNSGHLPINVGDFQSDLSIMLNPGSEILNATVIDTMPVDLHERLSTQQQSLLKNIGKEQLSLRPVLLNEGDAITVQILARNTNGEIKVRGHLNGIKGINIWHKSRLVPKLFIQLGALIMAFAMLGVDPDDLMRYRFDHVLPWLLIFLVGFVFLQAGIYWPSSGERRESFGPYFGT